MGIFGKKKQSPIVVPTTENVASHAEFTTAMMKNVNRGYALADPGPDYSVERTHAALDALTWFALENEDIDLLSTLTRISHTYLIGNPYDPSHSPEFWGKYLFLTNPETAYWLQKFSTAGNHQLADDVTSFAGPALLILDQLPEFGAVYGAVTSYAKKVADEGNS